MIPDFYPIADLSGDFIGRVSSDVTGVDESTIPEPAPPECMIIVDFDGNTTLYMYDYDNQVYEEAESVIEVNRNDAEWQGGTTDEEV